MSPAYEDRRHAAMLSHQLQLVDEYRVLVDGYAVPDNVVRGDE